MRNPMSYKTSSHAIFTGKEINDWCEEQEKHGTARAREARRLLRKNYKEDRLYEAKWWYKNSGSGSSETIYFVRLV